MKILRSKGNSFTEPDDGKLGRGLALNSQTQLTPGEFRTNDRNTVVRPGALARYVGEDYALILRQTISVLDKVIRKPRRLSEFELHAYIDRTFLSEELWNLLKNSFQEKIKALPEGDTAFAAFESAWRSKVHPYARDPYNAASPRSDPNARFLQDKQQIGRTRTEFQGRWHRVFWIEQDGSPDYAAIAQGIWQHLFKQERTLAEPDEKEQRHYVVRKDRSTGRPTGKGLIEARGQSMRNSTNDPRIGKKKEKTRHWNDTGIGKEIEGIYFAHDIAARIHQDALENVSCNELISRSFFGSRLHEHFGPILTAHYQDDERKPLLWALHNAVREHYQKIAKSERFRRCGTISVTERKQCSQAPCEHLDRMKLAQLLPKNFGELLEVLKARQRNADFSELIRLGKIIAHASELPLDTDPADLNKLFKERLDYFVTSAGQSVIKQNETFTRVWRTSTGLALRTLQVWADPEQKALANKKDRDLASPDVAKQTVLRKNFDLSRYQAHTPLLFGQKEIDALGGKSRASIFDSNDSTIGRHLQWAFLRLTGEIRNRTNHFDTKARLVDIFDRKVLLPARDENGQTKNRLEDFKQYEIGEAAEKAFSELLRFDLDLQKQILIDDLSRLQATRYLSQPDLRKVLPHILPSGEDLTLITPKFTSIIRRAQRLAADHPAGLSKAVRKFRGIDLDGLVETKGGVNHFKIGLLRQVYDQGFARWLSEQKTDAEWVSATVQAVTAAKKARKEEVRQENGDQPYGLEPTVVEQLSLDRVGDLDALQNALLSMTMGDERINRGYRVDRKRQSERSGWIVEFQQELYAHMFADFLSRNDGLDRILAAEEVTESDPAVNRVVIEKLIDEHSWTSPVETHMEDWNAQFYAWLYLVPSDQVSRLRHQFRKTAALADKTSHLVGYRTHSELSDERRQAIISQFDRLMGLYTSAQSAGFGGKEHERAALATSFDFKSLYEDETQFADVYSDAFEDHNASFPGTRRGLRQWLRFGQANVLRDIFERHKIQAEEVQTFIDLQTDSSKKELFSDRRSLHELIVKENKNDNANPLELLQTCNAYRAAATDTAIYVFQANSARLTDHARLHYLLMKIVGRLVDFTLIWERDNSYALLGLLYRTVQAKGGELQLIQQTRANADKTRYAAEEIWLNIPSSTAPIQMKLWTDREGWSLNYGDQTDTLNDFLPKEILKEYQRYFYKSPSENEKDQHVREEAERDDKEARQSHHTRGKFQIRHDFAHYNVLHTKAKPKKPGEDTDVKAANLNLCYLINVVRSLLSYDRKLKNTVIKTISDLLFEEGFVVTWSFKGDRVINPVILPRVETHLAFVDRRKFDGGPRQDRRRLETARQKGVSFDIPRHSPRYTSMVKAMFDFGRSGNGQDVRDLRGGKAKRIRYPGTPEGVKWNVPDKIADLEIISRS